MVPNKCYICGFTYSSEEAFKEHSEKCHNQEYIIQRSDSVTKSPPTKKPKEHHTEQMDIEPQSNEAQKAKVISDLSALVVQLQHQLQLEKINRENREIPPEIIENVKVTEVFAVQVNIANSKAT